MIVKTGANYQTEGGYIEASKNGNAYEFTTNDKSVVGVGSDETGPFITPITFINETGRTLTPTCFANLSTFPEVLGAPVSIGVDETRTFNCVGLVGIRQKMSYSGTDVEVKCESEYVVVENSGPYLVYIITKAPENGEPITMRLYI